MSSERYLRCDDCGFAWLTFRLMGDCIKCGSCDVEESDAKPRVWDKPTPDGQKNFEESQARERRLRSL